MKKLIKTDKYDDLMYDVEGGAFIIMTICVLALFPVYQFLRAYFRLLLLIFGVAALIGFGIRIIFRIKDIILYKNTIYQGMFEAQEEERKRRLDNENSKSKKE